MDFIIMVLILGPLGNGHIPQVQEAQSEEHLLWEAWRCIWVANSHIHHSFEVFLVAQSSLPFPWTSLKRSLCKKIAVRLSTDIRWLKEGSAFAGGGEAEQEWAVVAGGRWNPGVAGGVCSRAVGSLCIEGMDCEERDLRLTQQTTGVTSWFPIVRRRICQDVGIPGGKQDGGVEVFLKWVLINTCEFTLHSPWWGLDRQLTFLTKLYMAYLMWSHTVIINADTMTYLHNFFSCAFQ